jgi:hypothetical protein
VHVQLQVPASPRASRQSSETSPRALYRRYGFTSGPAFGDYRASEFNQFLHLDLGPVSRCRTGG